MTLASGIDVSLAAVAAVCSRFRVRELAVFGSAARGDARPDSDIDLLVEFEGGSHPGLAWFELEEALEGVLGHRVDLTLKHLLRPRVRVEAERDAVVLYGT